MLLLMTEKGKFEELTVPPEAGLETAMLIFLGFVISAAVMAACNWLLKRKVVGRALPFHKTVDPETKLVPFTINAKAGPPAMMLPGLSDVIAGAVEMSCVIVKAKLEEVSEPPEPGVET